MQEDDGVESVDKSRESLAKVLGADKGFMPVAASADPLVEVAGAAVDVDKTMREYSRAVRRLALSLLRAMAVKLGLGRRHFDAGWYGRGPARASPVRHDDGGVTISAFRARAPPPTAGRSPTPALPRCTTSRSGPPTPRRTPTATSARTNT